VLVLSAGREAAEDVAQASEGAGARLGIVLGEVGGAAVELHGVDVSGGADFAASDAHAVVLNRGTRVACDDVVQIGRNVLGSTLDVAGTDPLAVLDVGVRTAGGGVNGVVSVCDP